MAITNGMVVLIGRLQPKLETAFDAGSWFGACSALYRSSDRRGAFAVVRLWGFETTFKGRWMHCIAQVARLTVLLPRPKVEDH